MSTQILRRHVIQTINFHARQLARVKSASLYVRARATMVAEYSHCHCFCCT